MATVLVAYATRGGTAHDIAEAVAAVARDAGHDVTVADLRDKPSARADLVVVGSGVNAGAWYPEAVSWVARHTDTLRETKVAVFNACLNAADATKREESLAYNKVGADRLGAFASEAFAGRFVPHRVGWLRRVFLKTMQQQPQDHLDLERVRVWARELVAEL